MTVFLQLVMVLMSVQAADISVTIDPSTVEFTEFWGFNQTENYNRSEIKRSTSRKTIFFSTSSVIT